MFQCEPYERGQCQGLTDRLDELREQEVVAYAVLGESARHEAGEADERKTQRDQPPCVDEAKDSCDSRCKHELRQCNPQQHATDLNRAIILYGREVLGNDIGGGKNRKAQEGDRKHNKGEVAANHEGQVDPWPVMEDRNYFRFDRLVFRAEVFVELVPLLPTKFILWPC